MGAPDHFWLFCLWYDYEFFSQRAFLKPVALAFQWLYDEYIAGRARKISVSMPPRAGKSYITSLFCAWWLGKLPELAVMRNTVTSALYRKFSYDVRDVIRDNRYKATFPDTILSADNQNIDGWSITLSKQGAYFGGGVGTNIIGYGANLAVSDDLYSGFAQAISETYNDGLMMWKQGSHNSRMEKNCPEIYIGSRWSLSDIIGKAIDGKMIDKIIKIPALVNEETFCEAVKTTQEYLDIKANTTDAIWDAEYMQEPVEVKGRLYKSFKTYKQLPTVYKAKRAVVDTADEGDDYLCSGVYLPTPYGYFLIDVYYTQDGMEVTEDATAEQLAKYEVQRVRIESNNGGRSFARNVEKASRLIGNTKTLFTWFHQTQNKQARIYTQAAEVQNMIYYPEDWERRWPAFSRHVKSYMAQGRNEHDDAEDMLTMIIEAEKINKAGVIIANTEPEKINPFDWI